MSLILTTPRPVSIVGRRVELARTLRLSKPIDLALPGVQVESVEVSLPFGTRGLVHKSIKDGDVQKAYVEFQATEEVQIKAWVEVPCLKILD